MNLFFDRKQSIQTGQTATVYAEGTAKVGTPITFFSKLGQHLGNKPIATGVVVNVYKDDAKAPRTPTKTGKRNANAWRNLVQVKVMEIVEEQ